MTPGGSYYVKIAVSGTHFSGKTTFGQALAERLKGFAFVEEPYHQLVRDGYEFADVPTTDDFLEQLQVSVASITEFDGKAVFDRCPLDFVAYALSLEERDEVDVEEWVRAARAGCEALDLIVFCGIETPDRITVPSGEDRALRKKVDRKLKDMVLDDSLGLLSGVQVVELRGSVEDRLRQVLAYAGGGV